MCARVGQHECVRVWVSMSVRACGSVGVCACVDQQEFVHAWVSGSLYARG